MFPTTLTGVRNSQKACFFGFFFFFGPFLGFSKGVTTPKTWSKNTPKSRTLVSLSFTSL